MKFPGRPRTFRVKLALLVTLTAGVTALFLSFMLLSGQHRRMRIEALESVRTQAEALAIHTQAALRFVDPEAAQETVDALSPIQNLMSAAVFDAQGNAIAQFTRDLSKVPALQPGHVGPRIADNWLLFEQPVRQAHETIGTVILAYDISWQRRALWASIVSAFLAALGAVGVGLLIAWPLQHAVAAPVGELVRVAKSVASGGDFSLRARPRSSQGELGMLTTVFNSMLERVEQHDETIRKANERYDLVNRATNEVLRDWELRSDRMQWSEAAYSNLGWTPDELNGSSAVWFERIHPEDREGVRHSLQTALDGAATLWQGEYRLQRKNDTYGHYMDRALIARDASGRAERVIASMLDLTSRKRAEAAVQDAAMRLRTLMNAIPAFVWVADADGRILDFNERWHDFTGLGHEASAGAGWLQAVHEDDAPAVLKRWQEAVRVREPFDAELRLRRSDGVYRWFVVRALPVSTAQGITGWYGTSVDIEDRKRIEQERDLLLESERAARGQAERASRTKDDFLSTLSHELRTPLSAILGWAQVLGQLERVTENTTISEGVAIIERNARAQAHLIDDLLDMSRIESGKLRLDVQTVDLSAIIDAAVESVQPAADAKGIRIQRLLDPAAGPIQGDPSRLQQVVWNLLTNAIKFTPRGGRVEVVLKRIDSQLHITVSDTGQGIPADFIPHLFERFRQADPSTTRQVGGLGLGLAIVKHLIELHGGTVRAASAGRDQGATFTIELPVSIARPSVEFERARTVAGSGAGPEGLRSDEGASLAGLRILIVEDDPDARRLVRVLLERQAAQVMSAASAEEALEVLDEFAPDVLVSDIGMPGTDGYQFIRQVRQRSVNAGGTVPALALTAFARSEDRRRALIAGYEMHLAKPIEPSELIVSIAALARARRRRTGD